MDKVITIQGQPLFYRDEGSGEPVMLIHGFGEDGQVWDEVAKGLKGSCRLLIPDLPGSGRSGLLTEKTSMESLAGVLRELLDALSIDRCILIGHSMGGYTALAFAERYPEQVRAFGFFHSTAYPDTEEKRLNRRKSIEFIRQHGAAPYIRQSTPNLFAAGTRESRSYLVEDMISRFLDFNPDALIAYLEAMMERPDRVSVLERLQTPVLFIIGERDGLIPVDQALKQAHVPRIADVHLLPEAGHMGMLEAPESGSAIIQSFLNFIIQI